MFPSWKGKEGKPPRNTSETLRLCDLRTPPTGLWHAVVPHAYEGVIRVPSFPLSFSSLSLSFFFPLVFTGAGPERKCGFNIKAPSAPSHPPSGGRFRRKGETTPKKEESGEATGLSARRPKKNCLWCRRGKRGEMSTLCVVTDNRLTQSPTNKVALSDEGQPGHTGRHVDR